MDYEEFVRGCHLGVFPSYYEPWGYTPGNGHPPSLSFSLKMLGCVWAKQAKWQCYQTLIIACKVSSLSSHNSWVYSDGYSLCHYQSLWLWLLYIWECHWSSCLWIVHYWSEVQGYWGVCAAAISGIHLKFTFSLHVLVLLWSHLIDLFSCIDVTFSLFFQYMLEFCSQSRRQRIIQRNRTERLSELLDWEQLGKYYRMARKMALKCVHPDYFKRSGSATPVHVRRKRKKRGSVFILSSLLDR